MREIVLDTETTGLSPAEGHRVVEIACVELVNCIPSGNHFHRYINPERTMPEEAFAVHGLSEEFLKQHPVFAEIATDFIAFIGDSRLVIHNAEFDLNFLNHELSLLGMERLSSAVEDTLRLARRRFPGAPASLDALCRRFEIDLSRRDKHGALLDCELLAQVYLELTGGRQVGFEFAASRRQEREGGPVTRMMRPARPHHPSEEELAAHAALVKTLKEPIWLAGQAEA